MKNVREERRVGVVNVEEVRHVDVVVNDLAAVGSFDQHRTPLPRRPPARLPDSRYAFGRAERRKEIRLTFQ